MGHTESYDRNENGNIKERLLKFQLLWHLLFSSIWCVTMSFVFVQINRFKKFTFSLSVLFDDDYNLKWTYKANKITNSTLPNRMTFVFDVNALNPYHNPKVLTLKTKHLILQISLSDWDTDSICTDI